MNSIIEFLFYFILTFVFFSSLALILAYIYGWIVRKIEYKSKQNKSDQREESIN